MFMLTPMQALVLAAGSLAVVTALLLGVFVLMPRSRRVIAAYVVCPVLSHAVAARVARDEWTRGFREVVRCDALGRSAKVVCNQRCLRGQVTPLGNPTAS
jgi:hypothetical protein